jgi:hypothetical protein
MLNWEDVHHLADLAAIGLFLVTLYLVYLTARLSQPQAAPNSAEGPLRIAAVLKPRSRKITAILAAISGILTITLFLYAGRPIVGPPGPQGIQGIAGTQGPPGMPDTHVATAYWYRVELNNLSDLFARWNSATENELKNYLDNRGPTPLSADNDLGSIEANIKGIVRKDFGIELDFSRHPRFDANRFYPAPNVDQIMKDYDKEEYRRLYDQYSQTKYTLHQVVSAYERQIAVQEDYIVHVQRPSDCRYTQNGNFNCP